MRRLAASFAVLGGLVDVTAVACSVVVLLTVYRFKRLLAAARGSSESDSGSADKTDEKLKRSPSTSSSDSSAPFTEKEKMIQPATQQHPKEEAQKEKNSKAKQKNTRSRWMILLALSPFHIAAMSEFVDVLVDIPFILMALLVFLTGVRARCLLNQLRSVSGNVSQMRQAAWNHVKELVIDVPGESMLHLVVCVSACHCLSEISCSWHLACICRSFSVGLASDAHRHASSW